MFDTDRPHDLLESAAVLHERLLANARIIDGDNVAAVRALLAAVAFHGLFERAVIFGNSRYLSAELAEILEREHADFVEALGLMEDLGVDAADGSDLMALSRSVLARATDHLERDRRTIYGALARLGPIPAPAGRRERPAEPLE